MGEARRPEIVCRKAVCFAFYVFVFSNFASFSVHADLTDKKLTDKKITQLSTRDAGALIEELSSLYAYNEDIHALDSAENGAEEIYRNRKIENVSDALAMGKAYLALYSSTGSNKYLEQSEACANFILQNLQSEKGKEANSSAARYLNLLSHYTGNDAYKKMALSIMAVDHNKPDAEVRLAMEELASAPLHLTIVGDKENPISRQLFMAALKVPSAYRRIEWLDKKDGLKFRGIQYPDLASPAAFVCTNKRCSLPIFKPEDIAEFVKRSRQPKIERH